MEKPKPGEKYTHVKNNITYTVIATGINTETEEEMVVYSAASENSVGLRFQPVANIWIRPLSEFMDGRFIPWRNK